MKKFNTKYPIFSLITLFGMGLPLLSCPVTIKNDNGMRDGGIAVYDIVTGKLVKIGPGKTETIGDASQLANFLIFTKERHNHFNCYASVTQNRCDDKKNPQILFSEIKNETVGDLFTVKKVHSSAGKKACGCGKK